MQPRGLLALSVPQSTGGHARDHITMAELVTQFGTTLLSCRLRAGWYCGITTWQPAIDTDATSHVVLGLMQVCSVHLDATYLLPMDLPTYCQLLVLDHHNPSWSGSEQEREGNDSRTSSGRGSLGWRDSLIQSASIETLSPRKRLNSGTTDSRRLS